MKPPIKTIDDRDDCADQACVPVDRCVKWECIRKTGGNVPPLELRGKYWCCPICFASYGEHAKG